MESRPRVRDVTSPTGARVIEPLMKPHGQKLQERQQKLGPFEDEKLGVYHGQLDQMENVFEQARQVRTGLQKMYAERNQQILDSLAQIRSDTDARTREHNERLKEYSKEFDANLSQGNKDLIAQLKTDLVAVGKRYTAAKNRIPRLDEMIKKEAEECQENAVRETAAIAKRLQEHSDNLEEQKVERKEQHESYCAALVEHFRVIREKLQEETKARKEQFVVINEKAVEEYAAMNVVRDVEDVAIKQKLEVLRKALQEQNVDRVEAQKSVAKDMMHYMAQFEQAIKDMNKAQEETTKQLNTVKKKTGFAEMNC